MSVSRTVPVLPPHYTAAPLNWCPYCDEPDCWGYDYCQECGAFFDVVAPAERQPTVRVLDVEVFGVARNDGAGINYYREIVSSERLAALRSMPYADYLETPEWFNVRMAALDAAGSRCQVCNCDDALQVHHRTYERRGNEVLEDLTVLCSECHQRFHEFAEPVPGGEPPPAQRVRLVIPPGMLPA